MSKVAIVTDSNSGITQEQGKELGIFVLPMPFFIDGELYLEDITLSQSEFYEKLGADSDISTSQPSPGEVMDLWDKVLEEYDELVCIPMSSGLSSTCATAITLAAEYDGRVQVVDNQRISVTQEQSVLDAMNLREEGKSAAEIKEILEKEKLQASIYITVDTLKYLKKGGRITPAAAAIGTVSAAAIAAAAVAAPVRRAAAAPACPACRSAPTPPVTLRMPPLWHPSAPSAWMISRKQGAGKQRRRQCSMQ